MESLLPESAHMIGLDENTACVIDLAVHSVEVFGSGRVILRHAGHEKAFLAGATFSLEELK
jgi:cyanophycinase-like exopeptidase